MVTGVNVIAVYVTDMDKALEFYCGLLELKDTGELGPGRMLKAGDMSIYVEATRESAKEDALNRADVTLCLAVDSVKKACTDLKASGVDICMDYIEYSPEFSMFMVKDPDGNVVEFAGRP